MDINDKKKLINKAINAHLKKFKLEEKHTVKIGFMSENEELGAIKHLATGNIALDTLTKGGWIEGHINQVYGAEGAGKSTTFLKSIAYQQAIDPDYVAAYLDNEKTFDRDYAIALGVQMDRLVFGRFETNEESVDFCIACLDMGINALYIDTIQALASVGELYKGKDVKSTESNTMALTISAICEKLHIYYIIN